VGTHFDRRGLDTLTIFAAHASLLVQNALLLDELRADNRGLRERLEQQRFGDLLGSCPGMQEVYRQIEKVAPTDLSVLVVGETGTGKELVRPGAPPTQPPGDRARSWPSTAGAMPETLLESELFGHVKGAFTGAVRHPAGRFQQASGGRCSSTRSGTCPQCSKSSCSRHCKTGRCRRWATTATSRWTSGSSPRRTGRWRTR
jgi:transcriptional regulator with GAF, ATPase, and Fis domain